MTAYQPLAAGELAQSRGPRVGLVLDLPHHLLEEVLDWEDAQVAPVLVDDQGERGALDLEVVQEVVEWAGLGDDRGIADGGADLALRPIAHAEAGGGAWVGLSACTVGGCL